MKKSLLTLLWFLLLKGISCQLCPSLLSATQDPTTSCSFNNCSSLTCDFPQPSQLSGSVTFHVENCTGPARVSMAVALTGAPLAYKEFEATGFLHLALGRSVLVMMTRDSAFLHLEVEYRPVTANGTFTHPVVPRVQVPLYPTECMCESLTETAQGVHPNNLIHSCETNSNCDGVRCLISAVGQTGYVETIVLPCEGALDVMAEDQDFNVVSREVFYQTESRNVAIGGYSIRADVTIIHRDYSMDVALSLNQFFIGQVEVLPLHTIILDKTNCSSGPALNLTTLPPPPEPTPAPPPSPDSSPLCSSMYEGIVRQNYTEPFICNFLGSSCDAGVNCLFLFYGSSYRILLMATPLADRLFSYRVLDSSSSRVGVASQDNFTDVSMLSSPDGSQLIFSQISIGRYLTRIQINFMYGQLEIFDSLLPRTLISSKKETCQSILNVLSDPGNVCSPLGDCSGLSCRLTPPGSSVVARDIAVEVDKCALPQVVAMVTIASNVSSSRVNVTGAREIHFGAGEFLAVEMSRNATFLNFSTSFVSQTSSTSVIPPVLIPLNASVCMCRSLQDLAKMAGHSFIETNCSTNITTCNSIKCLLSVLGRTYFLETVFLPCEDAVEWLVEDGTSSVLAAYKFNQTGSLPVVVAGLPLTMDVRLDKHTYTMDVQANLTDPIFGKVEIIPMHTIILDRTNCNHRDFTTVAPSPPATPVPPPALGSSETCTGFYKAIAGAMQEPFICKYHQSCDVGIECVLKILSYTYDVVLSVSGSRTALNMAVSDGSGAELDDMVVGEGVNVALENPRNSSLNLTQKYDGDRQVLAMELVLYVYALNGELRKDVLIPYTEVVIKQEKSKSLSTGALAGIIIVGVLVLVGIAVVTVVLVLIVCKQIRTKEFDFQPMDSDNGGPSLTFSELEEKDKSEGDADANDRDSYDGEDKKVNLRSSPLLV